MRMGWGQRQAGPATVWEGFVASYRLANGNQRIKKEAKSEESNHCTPPERLAADKISPGFFCFCIPLFSSDFYR